MSEKSETPSEAEAREELFLGIREFGDYRYARETWRVAREHAGIDEHITAYRAAVLREADAETVALVERLYDHACDECRKEADAWLAKRGGGK